MLRNINRSLSALAILAALIATPLAPQAEEGKWEPMFNGKDLEGWTPVFKGEEPGVNYNDTFRVEDGKIIVSYDKWDKFDGKFGHMFYKSEHSHYKFRMEYRFVGEQCEGGPGWAVRNSGVMVHGQSVESMDKNQNFPVSIEVQPLGGDGTNPRTTGNLCTPGTNVVYNGKLDKRHCISSSSETYHGEQWVKLELEVHGAGKIIHKINGQSVIEYEQAQLDPRDKDAKKLIEARGGELILDKGTISLQAESAPVEFRNIEIMVLDKE